MIWACGFEKRREKKWTNIVSYKPRMYICVYGTSACVHGCLWYMCRHHQIFLREFCPKCSVSLQSVPKEYLRSPITAPPLFHCHYANVIAVKRTHSSPYTTVSLTSMPYWSNFHNFCSYTLRMLSFRWYSSPSWAKNVEFLLATRFTLHIIPNIYTHLLGILNCSVFREEKTHSCV